MKIATFNVNSIRARKDLVIRWIDEKIELDVLCLQEIKCEEKNFPYKDFEKLGFECAVFGQKAYNGVAILSKLGFDDVKKGFGNEKFDKEKRFIQTKINGINIINVYAPRGEGEKHTFKLDFFNYLKNYVKSNFDLKKDDLIIVGDMNIARDDIDVWEPELLRGTLGFMNDEREVFEDFLNIGLIDSYRELHPKEHGFTWWDYRNRAFWRNEGMRIDYILTSPPLFKKIKSIDVDLWTRKRRKPIPSDHAPVVIKISTQPINS